MLWFAQITGVSCCSNMHCLFCKSDLRLFCLQIGEHRTCFVLHNICRHNMIKLTMFQQCKSIKETRSVTTRQVSFVAMPLCNNGVPCSVTMALLDHCDATGVPYGSEMHWLLWPINNPGNVALYSHTPHCGHLATYSCRNIRGVVAL